MSTQARLRWRAISQVLLRQRRIPQSNQKSTELVLAPGILGLRLCKPLISNCRNGACFFWDLASTSANGDCEDLCVSLLCHERVLSWWQGGLEETLQSLLHPWPGRDASSPLPPPFPFQPSWAACWTRAENWSILKITQWKWRRKGMMNEVFLAEATPCAAQDHKGVLTLAGRVRRGWHKGSWWWVARSRSCLFQACHYEKPPHQHSGVFHGSVEGLEPYQDGLVAESIVNHIRNYKKAP